MFLTEKETYYLIPVYGAGPVTINSDRKGNVYLATTSEEKNVVVYQIPQ